MKANELRLGNWVKGSFLGELCKVTQLGHEKYSEYIGAKGDGFYGQNGFEPIPLTPEILVKAGFRQSISNEKVWVLKIGENNLMLKNDVAWFYWAGLSYPFKYLHQLQNLVYAIYGEELAIQL
jgi:hypothetical protein